MGRQTKKQVKILSVSESLSARNKIKQGKQRAQRGTGVLAGIGWGEEVAGVPSRNKRWGTGFADEGQQAMVPDAPVSLEARRSKQPGK